MYSSLAKNEIILLEWSFIGAGNRFYKIVLILYPILSLKLLNIKFGKAKEIQSLVS